MEEEIIIPEEETFDYSKLRYILNSRGYIHNASFGGYIVCDLGECTEYNGDVPGGYETIEKWFDGEIEKLNAWKIVDGNLVFDEEEYNNILSTSGNDVISTMGVCASSSGSNENGEWTKYADGTMETRQRYKCTFEKVTEWGDMFAYSINNIKDYPQEFKELPIVSVTMSVDHINGWLCTNVETGQESTSRPCGYQFVRPTERTPENTYLNVIAKGKWK